MQYSYTRLKTYENCPKQFDFRYIQGLPMKTNTGMRFGEKLHKLISDSLTGTADYSILDISQVQEAKGLVQNALAYIGDRTLVGSEIPVGVDKNSGRSPSRRLTYGVLWMPSSILLPKESSSSISRRIMPRSPRNNCSCTPCCQPPRSASFLKSSHSSP